MTELVLAGCSPEPLGSYLKALGVFRLVARQSDPSVRAWWRGDRFFIRSALGRDDLVSFLLDSYEPTPALSPWNKDAGFKEGSSTATKTLLRIEDSDDPRLSSYRQGISVVRRLRARPDWEAMSKEQQVALLRNRLPDAALDWLSAAVVVGPERLGYPALLGTGGNFGRFELSPTFMDRVLRVLDSSAKGRAASSAWLQAALFAVGSPRLLRDAAGQFDPGAAGGLRATAVGQGSAMTNPWDLVLTIEGAVTWASGAARRLDAASAVPSIPFTVAPSPVGQASLSQGEKAKAELWAPVWREPLGWSSLVRLFAEGRISWNGRQARSGLDAARAISNLGVDAGIDSFVRYVVADRMGQSPLAVAVGRPTVRERSGVGTLAELDGWIERLRRAALERGAPTSLQRGLGKVDRAMLVASTGRPTAFQDLLVAVSEAETSISSAVRSRGDRGVPPVPWLTASEWLPALDDGSVELRLAAAVALGRDGGLRNREDPRALVRTMVAPVQARPTTQDCFGRLAWADAAPLVPGLHRRPIESVLADVLVQRSEADRPRRDEMRTGTCEPSFPNGVMAGKDDAERFAGGEVDRRRLSALMGALLLLLPVSGSSSTLTIPVSDEPFPVVPAWRLLAPFYAQERLERPGDRESVELYPAVGWARRLVAGDVDRVMEDALVRLRLAGLSPIHSRSSLPALAAGVGDEPHLLAAALLCRVNRIDAQAALERVVDESDEGPKSAERSITRR